MLLSLGIARFGDEMSRFGVDLARVETSHSELLQNAIARLDRTSSLEAKIWVVGVERRRVVVGGQVAQHVAKIWELEADCDIHQVRDNEALVGFVEESGDKQGTD